MKSPELSIIIPTYNEGINVLKLAHRIEKILNNKIIYEVIFIDDSFDDTTIYLRQLNNLNKSLRYIHRTNQKGLASAVVEGFHQAKGEILIVMDGDLQHPPEIIEDLIKLVREGYEVVIPSRFVKDGKNEGLSVSRKAMSWLARIIARITLKRARSIKDPTSGFFAVKRSVIEKCDFEPIGWKILLEVITKGSYQNSVEIPYVFEYRNIGQSKMKFSQQLNYLYQIMNLLNITPKKMRFWKLLIVVLFVIFILLYINFR